MTLALRYAIRSDVGLLREGNEDAAYAGPRLLAVADGMGGHAAGEVASAAAISAIARLDDDVPGGDLLDALAGAVGEANHTLHDMVAADPVLEGMGTTLTAMLWSGGRVALVHIGDSRAYLLRDGEFHQITHDHTLVQTLVDEGRISPDDVATHPQRSMLLRALDGRADVEPDLSLREARLGDRYLLCSDGLSGVVSEETLHRTLAKVGNPDEVVLQLVELAIRGGGPGQHHLHRGGRGGQRDRAAAAQRHLADGRRGLQRQRRHPVPHRQPGRPGAPADPDLAAGRGDRAR